MISLSVSIRLQFIPILAQYKTLGWCIVRDLGSLDPCNVMKTFHRGFN